MNIKRFMKEYCSNLFHSIKKYKTLIAIIYSVLLIGLALLFLPIRFEENDDVVMLLLASGNYTGHFESNLVFINPIYGFIVSGLYRLINGVEWYTFLFIALHIISLAIIIHKVIFLKLKIVLKASLILFFSIIELNLIMYLQFTTVAMILSIAAVLLLNFENRRNFLVSSILLFLAGLIRFEAALLILMFMIPYFVYFIYVSKTYSRFFQLFILFLLILAPRFLSDLTMSQKWKDYNEFNRLRTKVNDNLNADYSEDIYRGVCSKEDYYLLKMFFPDPSSINSETLEQLIINIDNTKSFSKNIKNITMQILNYKHEFFLLIMLLISLILFNYHKKNNIYLLILYSFFLILILSYISIDGILKNRIFIGFIISVVILIVFYLQKIILSNISQYALTICFILITLFYSRRLTEKMNETKVIYTILNKQSELIDDFFEKHSNKKIVFFSDDFKLQYFNPFDISKRTKKWNLFFLGWMSKSPHNSSKIISFEDFTKDCVIFINNYNLKNNFFLIKSKKSLNRFEPKILFSDLNYTILQFVNSY